MAGSDADHGVGKGDLGAHVTDYGRMIAMLKWGAVAVAVIVACVIWLIA
ncbi:hypothetical protein [Sphingomonas abaci]|uniref:Aa3-type cytochrome c oxidase subunit IV n=1 Tax=Sphingomonas abaci TaxID=237611 RepID=A0A7W7AIZ8_9SPHN|nr:hypothetical protein [Sphingomonas abaci]MBB4617917.1 hypothetical protein [Sphingomonas abaci]